MKINLLSLENVPIFEQLQLEEALLRANEENWCLMNHGSPPAIVLGVSAKLPEVVDQAVFELKPVPLVRRFSGGGTVFVDQNTLFVTFIFNYPSSPDKVLQWSQEFYKPVFDSLPFQLKENDYTIGDKKVGGNAQYFRKSRFLHHTSFLYDYESSNMDYLLFPKKTPQYRLGRAHRDFITKLSDHFPRKEDVREEISRSLFKYYQVTTINSENIKNYLNQEHRKSTSLEKIN